MKPTSRICLFVAKLIPRGYFRILKFAAERDLALQDIFLPLKNIPLYLRGDLRESVFTSLYRTGNIPHQAGFDLLCQNLLHPGDLVFTIGTNVRYTTALLSHIVGSDDHTKVRHAA